MRTRPAADMGSQSLQRRNVGDHRQARERVAQ